LTPPKPLVRSFPQPRTRPARNPIASAPSGARPTGGRGLLGNPSDLRTAGPHDPPNGLSDGPAPARPSGPPKTALARVPEPACPPANRRARDRSLGESGDRYPGALFAIPGTNYRVAVCAKGYCWILQQREARDHWIRRKFFASKARLAKVLPEVVGPNTAAAVMPLVEALPI
jgi:hypothetical protein